MTFLRRNVIRLRAFTFATIVVVSCCLIMAGCVSSPHNARVLHPGTPQATVGMASYYGKEFAGRKTASGERFNPNALTAAHRTLPFGTRVRVTDLKSGRSVVVTVNDRGPFKKARIIDLSYQAAKEIGMILKGTGKVRVDVLGW